jgi:hypothetical protein
VVIPKEKVQDIEESESGDIGHLLDLFGLGGERRRKSWINGLSNSGVELGGETKKQEQSSGQAWSVCPRVSKPTIDWLASEVLNMKDKRRLLPIVKLYGSEYLVDIENQLFKKFREPESTIWFYSERGR